GVSTKSALAGDKPPRYEIPLKFLYIELGFNRARPTILANTHENNVNTMVSDFYHGICLFSGRR
ncbi:MAG: hypothetical protein AAB332_07770, partial [Planctomycetota bacterium]